MGDVRECSEEIPELVEEGRGLVEIEVGGLGNELVGN